MAFDMFKTHKLADQLESEAYEHCEWAIKSFYDLELEENEYGYEQNVYEVLNTEQITEIEAYVDEWLSPDKYHEPYSISALNRIVDQWHEVRYDENDVWDTAVSEVDKLTPKKEDGDEIMPDGYPKTFKVT